MSEDLEKRLAELRAQRRQLEAEAEQRAAERSLHDQVEAEERAIKDREAITKAEQDHGPVGRKLAVVETDLGAVILKRSNPLHYKRFSDAETLATAELEKLVRPCLVHPTMPTFEAYLEEQPAILLRCANAICVLAGVRAKEVSGKS